MHKRYSIFLIYYFKENNSNPKRKNNNNSILIFDVHRLYNMLCSKKDCIICFNI